MSTVPQDNLTRLYIDHQMWLQNYLRKQLTHRPDMAVDLVQDTFLTLIETPQKIPKMQEQRAYLLTIAKRKLFNFWRRQDLEQAYLQSLHDVGILQESVSVEQLCLIQDALMQIDALLSGLPVAVQHAFLLKKMEQLTHPEIAQLMNISLATVERYIKQATIHCLLQRKTLLNE